MAEEKEVVYTYTLNENVVSKLQEIVGGGGKNWIFKKENISEKTFTINYQPILDLLNENGYNTNLSLGELEQAELPYFYAPLTFYGSDAELRIEIGSTYQIAINGAGFNLEISSNDFTTPLKDIFANAPKTAETDSGGGEVYLLPWFDITPVNE